MNISESQELPIAPAVNCQAFGLKTLENHIVCAFPEVHSDPLAVEPFGCYRRSGATRERDQALHHQGC